MIKEKKSVIDIARGGNHNGPGYRTLVLFKGCPMRCKWCSTPDSQKLETEIGIFQDRCSLCGNCVKACPQMAIEIRDEKLVIDHSRCDGCALCMKVCHYKALKQYGTMMSIPELMKVIESDAILYKHSGGGVTFSGGEPLMTQPEFMEELMKTCKERGISAGIQTCGCVPWEHVKAVLPYTDFFLWDIKHMDSQKHREFTGHGNERILQNIHRVAMAEVPLYIRIPVIPNYTDSDENIRAICEMAQGLASVKSVDVIPIHHVGSSRYESLGIPYPIEGLPLITDERAAEIKGIIESYGFRCRMGG